MDAEMRDTVVAPRTAKDMFAVLRKFFDTSDDYLGRTTPEQYNVWAVLSALRGPDDQDIMAKRAWTFRIRKALLGDSAQHFSAPAIGMDSPELHNARTSMINDMKNLHFRTHAQDAFSVLGLNEYAVNQERP